MQVESFSDVWALVLEEIKKEVSAVCYNLWFNDTKLLEIKDGIFLISVSNEYKKTAIGENYIPMLKKFTTNLMGFETDIKIVVEGSSLKEAEETPGTSFEESFTFDNFIVGQTNRFAHAAAMAVAENPAKNATYNPLVIYGPSGVGKTHLLLAIKNEIAKKHPSYKVEFLRGEEFTNQLIRALQEGNIGLGTIDDFRNRYRNVDVLLMDDIHFIAGKEATQEEFFNTFNAILQNNKQIVVTLDRPPKDIATLETRIRSRFEDGLLADITPADFETRVGITKRKAEELGISLSEDTVFEIAKNIISNTRQLEGVVKKVQAYIQLDGKEPSIPALRNFIKDVITDVAPEPIKIETIIEEVARTYRVTDADILSNKKTSNIVLARQVAMYIAHEITNLTYEKIGESFGKDHSTVLYSVRKTEEYLKDKPYEKGIVDEIIRNIKE